MPESEDSRESVVGQFVTAGNSLAARVDVLVKLLLDSDVSLDDIIDGSDEAILKQRETNEGEFSE
jgi:hypothetical protein